MRQFRASTLIATAGLLIFGSCSSSDDSASKDQSSPASTTGQEQTAPPAGTETSQSSDTARAQGYDPRSPVPAQLPAGKFAVQVGAYKQQENAERVASLAKDRFGKNVYTIPDAASGLVKVYVGDFPSKDEARRFRDDMALKYPQDYKDAWVSEIPTK
jgi:cell division septation protein DedD